MVVGTGRITLRLHGCRSLKEKRKTVKSLIAGLSNRFNASVAEVGANDLLQRAEIGFSMVGNDSGKVNAGIDHAFDFAEKTALAEITDINMEMIHL
jgi:uncharacterized protein